MELQRKDKLTKPTTQQCGRLLLDIAKLALLSLWAYAALVKLGNMERNLAAMHKQVFAAPVAQVLAYALPLLELLTAGLLLVKERLGLLLSAGLLAAFSLYIGLVKLGSFGFIPCACGGIFSRLGYSAHLAINLAMLALALAAIYIKKQWEQPKTKNRVGEN